MRVRFLLILVSLLVIASGAVAQGTASKDTVIKGSTIEVIQSYKPEVKQAPKPDLTPGLPPTDTTHPILTYEVPQQTLYYTYSSLPLRPLALGKDTAALPFQNYVKLGAGNLSTVFLDAGIGSLCGKDYETAIHIHDLSQKGAIQYQQSSLAGVEAEGSLHRNSNVWHAMVDGERNQYYYYGYNHDLYQYNSDSVKQVYTTVRAGVDMQHDSSAYKKLNYHPAVTASLFTDKFNATETTIGFNLPFSYTIDTSLQLQLGLNGTFTELKTSVATNSNNIIQLVPGIVYHNNSLSGHIYLSPAIGQNSFYFLPDIGAAYKIPYSSFIINAGWQATLNQNTFEQLSTENPYISDLYNIQQTRKDEVFGSVQSNVGNHFTFSARASWWSFSNLPLFVNDNGDQRQFNVVYDTRLNATSVQGMVRYQIANTFAAGISGTFYNFYNGTYLHPWEEPGVRIKGDLLFRPVPRLAITAYLSALDDMYALNINDNAVKMKAILDIGGNVEYNIIPRLSVFIQATNLLNNKYERWLGYEAYGMNIYGGIRFKF
jgi:hypothetical protein